MKLLDRLFRRTKPESAVPAEVREVFRKIEHFLNDDETQNAAESKYLRGMMMAGEAVDRLPGATGDFGHCPTSPVPVNGINGALTYVSSLRTVSGLPLFGHQLGAADGVTVFETVSTDGTVWDFLFLDLWHPKKSRLLPKGYTRHRVEFITCTKCRVPDFPFGLRAAISQSTKDMLRVPLVPPAIEETLRRNNFVRPAAHAARLTKIERLVQFQRAFTLDEPKPPAEPSSDLEPAHSIAVNANGKPGARVEYQRDGRTLITTFENTSDAVSGLMALFQIAWDKVSNNDQRTFAREMRLAASSDSRECRELFSLAMVHLIIESRSSSKELPPALSAFASQVPRAFPVPLPVPLTPEVRRILLGLFAKSGSV